MAADENRIAMQAMQRSEESARALNQCARAKNYATKTRARAIQKVPADENIESQCKRCCAARRARGLSPVRQSKELRNKKRAHEALTQGRTGPINIVTCRSAPAPA